MIHVTKSQILHFLSAFVFTPLAGFTTAWVAKHFPGLPHFSQGEVTAFFITGASSALGLAIHYLHGWQLWERVFGKVIDVEDKAVKPKAKPRAKKAKPDLVTPVKPA